MAQARVWVALLCAVVFVPHWVIYVLYRYYKYHETERERARGRPIWPPDLLFGSMRMDLFGVRSFEACDFSLRIRSVSDNWHVAHTQNFGVVYRSLRSGDWVVLVIFDCLRWRRRTKTKEKKMIQTGSVWIYAVWISLCVLRFVCTRTPERMCAVNGSIIYYVHIHNFTCIFWKCHAREWRKEFAGWFCGARALCGFFFLRSDVWIHVLMLYSICVTIYNTQIGV